MKLRTKIKVCGITRVDDAILACRLGADAIGLNFHRPSPRYIEPSRAREIVRAIPAFVDTVAVFVNTPMEEVVATLDNTGIATAQLHGEEPPDQLARLAPRRVLRAFRWQGKATGEEITQYLGECRKLGHLPCGLLIDAYRKGVPGGTGESWDWAEAKQIDSTIPLILAGGLNPGNVANAIRMAQPYAVDVASGVESQPGIKDAGKLKEFFDAVCVGDHKS